MVRLVRVAGRPGHWLLPADRRHRPGVLRRPARRAGDVVGLPGADRPAPGHGSGCDAADVSWFHLRAGYGSRRSPDLGRGPRPRPGLLHPQPCGGDLLIPQQRHRRPASLGSVRLRSDLHPRLSFRGWRPYHRPHHRQGHGRQPHRPETRRKEGSPSHRTSSSQNRSPKRRRITSSTHTSINNSQTTQRPKTVQEQEGGIRSRKNAQRMVL